MYNWTQLQLSYMYTEVTQLTNYSPEKKWLASATTTYQAATMFSKNDLT